MTVTQATRWCTGAILTLTLACGAWAASETIADLAIGEKHAEISQNVTRIIEELHYSRPRIDNSFSSAILDRYLDTLDGNRLYFLNSDISSFGRFRYELDERTRSGELDPVFEIFNLFRARTQERIEYAIALLATVPDFSIDEEFRFDRSELPWPNSEEEMQEVWRQRVKNDGLSLILTGKNWDETAEILRERYERVLRRVGQLTSDDVFETFMNAMAHTMDPHSSYLSPRNSEEYRIQMSLSYDGIGASLQLEDDYVTVINVIPGGPAHLDGQLKPGDRITAVGQGVSGELEDVIGWRLDDVVQLIRGPGGTVVRLQVLAAGAVPGTPEQVIPLVRDKVKLEEQAAKSNLIEVPRDERTYRIGVIRVPSFYQDYAARSRGEEDYTSTTRDVARLIAEFEADGGIDGLVMDLRQNGGGHLSEATELSGLFLQRGPVVQLRETRGNTQVLDDPSPGAVYSGPLAVLVDRYSASASEIFAAAIQDYHRGIVIGQRTFGKGSVQNLFNLDRFMRAPGYGQLTLTIGKYYRVTGGSTQHRGVEPDIELPSIVDTETVGESTRDTALPWDQIEATGFPADPSLDAAIPVLEARYLQRTANDPDYNSLVDDIQAVGALRNRETVSLNLAARQAEREAMQDQQLRRENDRRAALGLDPLASVEELEAAEPPDILLEQATGVVADMASLQTPVSQATAASSDVPSLH
ncbi:MAG TPA: carboxy terminal-processing peptidase [Gammaproteobacteria bacterium]|nr:carboxy terminal-processing peptidase [Gammaproteobacteria bacterium]